MQVHTSEVGCTITCRDVGLKSAACMPARVPAFLFQISATSSRDGQDRGTSSWTRKFSQSPRPGDLPCRLRLLPPSSLLNNDHK